MSEDIGQNNPEWEDVIPANKIFKTNSSDNVGQRIERKVIGLIYPANFSYANALFQAFFRTKIKYIVDQPKVFPKEYVIVQGVFWSKLPKHITMLMNRFNSTFIING